MKKIKPGKPDPSRFAVGAEDVVPVGRVRVIDMLTEEQRQENAAHDEALRQAFEEDDKG